MKNNIADLTIKVQADISNLEKQLKAVQDAFSKLSGEGVSRLKLNTNIDQAFRKLIEYKELLEKIQVSGDKKDYTRFIGMAKEVETSIGLIQKRLDELNSSDLQLETFNVKGFKEKKIKLEAEADDLKNTLGEKLSAIDKVIKSKILYTGATDMPKFREALKKALAVDPADIDVQNIESIINNMINAMRTAAETNLNKKNAPIIDFDKILNSENIEKEVDAALQKLDNNNKFDRTRKQLEGLKGISSIKFNTQEISKLGKELQKLNAQINVKESERVKKVLEDVAKAASGIGGTTKALKGVNSEISNTIHNTFDMQTQLSQAINQFGRFTTLSGMMHIFSRAIRSAFQSVKELDEAMNSIAVVTDMTTKDLWDQIDAYTILAQKTGSTIKGAYEVAQLYYQQGLSDTDVIAATEETLKMARIANIDYAKATDYATAAIKGFNLAYQDLAHINDVYSNLAAKTAADTEEISIAMSKVASIAHSTGMELETTAAFLTQIISTTREAPETAGTALKTVIARFSEVKKLASEGKTTGTDSEGEEIDINKMETALAIANVALRDEEGQMRKLDDVMIELASRWDQLSTLQQRYIATQAAGSRQQSRFLALMNDYDGLMETLGYATNSADASQKQFTKTMDSLQSKLNALSNAWTEFTTGIANSDLIKAAVDALTHMLNIINDLTESSNGWWESIKKITVLIGGLKLGGAVASSTLASFGLGGQAFKEVLPGAFPLITGATKWVKGGISNIKEGKNSYQAKELKKLAYLRLEKNKLSEYYNTHNFANPEELFKVEDALDSLDKQIVTTSNNAQRGGKGILGYITAFTGLSPTVLIVIASIVALGVAMYGLYRYITRNTRAFKEHQEVLEETAKDVEEYESKISSLENAEQGIATLNEETGEVEGKNLKQLAQGVDKYGNNLSLTNEEYEQYKNIVQSLVDEGIVDSFEEFNLNLKNQADYIDELINKFKQLKIEAAQAAANEWDNSVTSGAIEKYQEQYEKAEGVLHSESGVVNDSKFRHNIQAEYETLQQDEKYGNLFSLYDPEDASSGLSLVNYSAENKDLYDAFLKDLQAGTYNSKFGSNTDAMITAIENAREVFNSVYTDASAEVLAGLEENSKGLIEDYINLLNTSGESNSYGYQGLLTFIKNSDRFRINEDTGIEGTNWNKELILGLAEMLKTGEGKELLDKLYSPEAFGGMSVADAEEYQKQLIENILSTLSKDTTDEQYVNFFKDSQQIGLTEKNRKLLNQVAEDGGKFAGANVEKFFDEMDQGMAEAINSGAINLEALINDEDIKTFDELKAKIEELYEASNKVNLFDNIDSRKIHIIADGIKEIQKNIDSIDEEELKKAILADGTVDKDSIAFSRLIDQFNSLDEAAHGALSAMGITSEDLTEEYILTEGNAEAWANYANNKASALLAQVAYNTPDFSAEIQQVNSAAEAWAALNAYRQGLISGGPRYTQEGYNALYSAATLLTSATQAKVNRKGKGGGGGKKAKASQDPFYNYIKQVEQTENTLKRLQTHLELLTDPTQIKNNLEEQQEALINVMASNQGYLNEVDKQLNLKQQEGMKKYSEYFSFAEDGSLRLTEKYFNATGKTAEELDAWIESYDDVLGRQTSLNEELDNYKKQIKDLWEEWRDSYIEIQNEIAEVLQEQDEKMLEEKEEFYEKMEEKDSEYLESVRENIEAERKAREKAKNFEDLAKKQKRLALLERDTSGRYESDILKLREEISAEQEEMADNEVDDILDALEKKNEEEAKRHEQILERMQDQIDEYVENRTYLERAEEIIEKGDQAIIEALKKGDEYQQASNVQRQKMLDTWGPTIGKLQQYIDSQATTAMEYVTKLTSKMTDEADKIIFAIGNIKPIVINGGGGGTGGNDNNTSSIVPHDMKTLLAQKRIDIFKADQNYKLTPNIRDEHGFLIYDTTGQDLEYSGGNFHSRNDAQAIYNMIISQAPELKNRKKVIYKKGGLVDFTGPAWVDGTPGSPEAFLNANQTKIISDFAYNLSKIVNGGLSGFQNGGMTAGDCNINIDIGSIDSKTNLDNLISKIRDEIMRSSQYRNINTVSRMR